MGKELIPDLPFIIRELIYFINHIFLIAIAFFSCNVTLRLLDGRRMCNQCHLQQFIFLSTIRKICSLESIPTGIYLFKVNNRNTRAMYEICSKLTIMTLEGCQ